VRALEVPPPPAPQVGIDDALVIGEVLGSLRNSRSSQVRRRCDGHATGRSDPPRHERAVAELADAYCDVEALGDQVDVPVVMVAWIWTLGWVFRNSRIRCPSFSLPNAVDDVT
jgi:hypothetical protein